MGGSMISRRGLMVGLGAAGGAVAFGSAGPAAAGTAAASGHVQIDAPPGGIAPISSTPKAGVGYEFRSFLDFTAEDDLLYGRKFGGDGVYTSAASDFLAASFDLPAGVTLYDLEWYVSNSVAMNVYANLWQSGQGALVTFWSQSIPAGSGITATRFVIPSNVNGPYPHGTRLIVACSSPSSGSALLNGVRAGFKHAPRSPVLLTTPARAYDSRTSGGRLAGGHSRTISLSSHIPPGAAGAIIDLSVVDTLASGYLKVHAAGTPAPATTAIRWFGSGQALVNQTMTAISLNRSIKITAVGARSTQFVIDVLGYLV